jgi:hypothetical protein
VFQDQCYGVRVAKVEDLLKQAKQCGLKKPEDLSTYVAALLDDPARLTENRWLAAIQQAVTGRMPLDAYFRA